MSLVQLATTLPDAQQVAIVDHYGRKVRIFPTAKIYLPSDGDFTIGHDVIIDDFVFAILGHESKIGSFVHIGVHSSILGGGRFVMEDFSGLSAGVRIFTGNDDYKDGALTNPTVPHDYRTTTRSFVHLEKHCVVGANAVILPGVTMHEGSVLGANSLAKRDLVPWGIYAGNPCRQIGTRNREGVLEREALLWKRQ